MQRVPSIFKNDGRHPERPGLGERSTLTNRTIPRAKAFICCVNVTSKVSPKVSPPFWTQALSEIYVPCRALFPLIALIVRRRILGLGLQGIVMVDKCKGSQGLDHAGDDPGYDDGVLMFANCSHAGEDEDIHDEGLQHQQDRRHDDRPGVPVSLGSLALWFAGRLEAGIGEEPDADSEEDGGKRQGEEDRHGAQAEAQSCDQDCRGQAQIEGIVIFRLGWFGRLTFLSRLRWLLDRSRRILCGSLIGLARLVVMRGTIMLSVYVTGLFLFISYFRSALIGVLVG